MQLYYHRTDGGAEYYSIQCTTTPDGTKEGIAPFILRTDGDEIEVFTEAIEAQGIKLIIK